MPEIELKFLVDERATRQLRAKLRQMDLPTTPTRTKSLRSIYFDTSDHALKAAGYAVRLRRDGRRWVQTIKTRPSAAAGLSESDEFECPAPGGRLRFEAVPDAGVRARILELIDGKGIGPICESVIRRTSSQLTLGDGTRAELAFDVGEIVASENAMPLREAEVELIEGSVTALFDLARNLLPEGGLRFSHLSKAERGYLLAVDGAIDAAARPRNAMTVELTPGMTSEQAAREVLRECFDQIAVNCDVVRACDDPEGPHQLRVGLRRLRSAFLSFRAAVGSPELERLSAEAKWLGQEVGALRDLDVARIDILEPEAAAHPDEPGFASLARSLEAEAGTVREGVRALLGGARVQAFLMDLARFVETRGWLLPEDMDQSGRLAAPVGELARAALDARWKAAAKRARGIDHLGHDARHDLRKELKKLRYAVEFFAPPFPPKKVAPFVRRLKKLQAVFVDLTDATMARTLFSGANAPGAKDLAAQRASGWIIGARLARAEHGWAGARSLWRDLKSLKPFWR
jgi:inorganic triphosphatase YgiF